jgi:hypothetical protein
LGIHGNGGKFDVRRQIEDFGGDFEGEISWRNVGKKLRAWFQRKFTLKLISRGFSWKISL